MENLIMMLEIEKSLKQLEILGQLLRWQKKAERSLTLKLRKLFKAPFERIISKLRKMKSVPSGVIGRKQLLFEIEDLKKEFKEIISEAALEAADVGRKRVLLFVDSLVSKKEMHFENSIKQVSVEMPLLEYSKTFKRIIKHSVFVASERTMNRIAGDTMDNLTDSYVKGLGIDEAAGNLGKVFSSMEDYELERIARTEIQSYQNLGSYNTCNELDVQYVQWWAARDERVRSSHIDIHGQIVKMGGRFSNDLRYPGDRMGPIAEWINCRCKVVPFIMPFGYAAPAGVKFFYEGDLVATRIVEAHEFERGHLEHMSHENSVDRTLKDFKSVGIDLDYDTAEEMTMYVRSFSGTDYTNVRHAQREILAGEKPSLLFKKGVEERVENIENFIKNSPNYPKDETILRGINLTRSEAGYRGDLDYLKVAKKGDTFNMGGTSSWTSDISDVPNFSGYGENAIGFILEGGSNSSVSVKHISAFAGEDEILISMNSNFKVLQEPIYGRIDDVVSGKDLHKVLGVVDPTPEVIETLIKQAGERNWLILGEI